MFPSLLGGLKERTPITDGTARAIGSPEAIMHKPIVHRTQRNVPNGLVANWNETIFTTFIFFFA